MQINNIIAAFKYENYIYILRQLNTSNKNNNKNDDVKKSSKFYLFCRMDLNAEDGIFRCCLF